MSKLVPSWSSIYLVKYSMLFIIPSSSLQKCARTLQHGYNHIFLQYWDSLLKPLARALHVSTSLLLLIPHGWSASSAYLVLLRKEQVLGMVAGKHILHLREAYKSKSWWNFGPGPNRGGRKKIKLFQSFSWVSLKLGGCPNKSKGPKFQKV